MIARPTDVDLHVPDRRCFRPISALEMRDYFDLATFRGCAEHSSSVYAPSMKLVGMFDSPYVRRVAISMRFLDLPFEHVNWSIGTFRRASHGESARL